MREILADIAFVAEQFSDQVRVSCGTGVVSLTLPGVSLTRVRGPRAHAGGSDAGKAADFLGFCRGRAAKTRKT